MKRLGTFGGVIHLVKGMRLSRAKVSYMPWHHDCAKSIPTSGLPPFRDSHFVKGTSFLCTAFLPASRSESSTSKRRPKPLFNASNIPLSSNVSLTAASLYVSLSMCLFGSPSAGTVPSWKVSTFPPGNTWAEGNDLEVWTR